MFVARTRKKAIKYPFEVILSVGVFSFFQKSFLSMSAWNVRYDTSFTLCLWYAVPCWHMQTMKIRADKVRIAAVITLVSVHFSHSAFYFVCMFPVCIYLVVEIYICTRSLWESHMFNCKISILGESLALGSPQGCSKTLLWLSSVWGSCYPFYLVDSQEEFFSVAESKIKCLPLHR